MATPASWQAAVTSRIDNDTLVALTNSDSATQNPSPTVDTARLDVAIDDAKAEFSVRAGFDPKLDDPSHVATIMMGVLAYLMAYKGVMSGDVENAMFRFMGKCDKIRNIYTAAPGTTNSGNNALTPSQEAPDGRVVRPDADRSNFQRFLPRNLLNRRDRFLDRW